MKTLPSTSILRFAISCTVAGALALPCLGINLIQNGGFEDTDLAGADFQDWAAVSEVDPAGTWTLGKGGFRVFNANDAGSGENVISGVQSGRYLYSEGDGVYQVIDTVPGYVHQISLLADSMFQNLGINLTVSIVGVGTGQVLYETVSRGGVALDLPKPDPLAFNASFTPTSEKSMVILENTRGTAFNWVILDDVAVVPEPHEYALAASLGLLGFVVYRRFRVR